MSMAVTRLNTILIRLHHRLGPLRGRGGAALSTLLARTQRSDVVMDEHTADQMADLLESMDMKLEDLRHEADRYRRHSIRGMR
jgi:ABC-type uncharacterized transport system ATPase component